MHVCTLSYDSDVPSAPRRWFLKYSTRVCCLFSTSLNLFQTRNSQRARERTRERGRAAPRTHISFQLLLMAGLPIFFSPYGYLRQLYSSIFLLIHFVNQYSILLGTNKTVVVVSRAALAWLLVTPANGRLARRVDKKKVNPPNLGSCSQ